MAKFPFYQQLDAMDCGPSCLRMIAKYYGKTYSLQDLREKASITREGVSLLGISDAAESIGMRTRAVRLPFEALSDVPLPCIAHWQQSHFVVVYKINKGTVYISDPAYGLITYTEKEFLNSWNSTVVEGIDKGIILLLEPSPDFYEKIDGAEKTSFKFLFSYLTPYKKYVFQLMLGLFVGSVLQLIFPFLTQSIVDYGINNQDINFVYTILAAQLVLYFSQTAVGFIRSWILLHVSTRINISFISDFLIKLMKLPMRYFDTKMIGDLLQRIDDHSRIESFLTSTSLEVLFSIVNLVVFGAVLLFYSGKIFIVFLFGALISTLWVTLLLKRRRVIDFKQFAEASKNQSSLIGLIYGMQEIKLNSCEKQKRWEWEGIQAKLFKVSLQGLALEQTQQAGNLFVNEIKNILISFLAAKLVIDGEITLGMMFAIQYIIGQLNAPVAQLIYFFQSTQDARISLERMGEIHQSENEENEEDVKITILPEKKEILLKGLDFRYQGSSSPLVLQDLNLCIPEGKTTAIVGVSGSGKTTLMKLLLKFYELTKGEIHIGDVNLQTISARAWRKKCGVVMQDGFIFNDTIARNIAVGEEYIDYDKLNNAVQQSNVHEFVKELPLGYNTKIGSDGNNLSVGQKQRLLIARAVYKDPEYLMFDEATSSLDANNERQIMENLDEFCKGKTTLVIAHRLSTVKNADQIVVLDSGKIVEVGDHKSLTALRGMYYNLVKNQLELGQ